MYRSSECLPFLATLACSPPFSSRNDIVHQCAFSLHGIQGYFLGRFHFDCRNISQQVANRSQYHNTNVTTKQPLYKHEWLLCILPHYSAIQLTTSSNILNIYPLVELLSSTSLAQSKSKKPCTSTCMSVSSLPW